MRPKLCGKEAKAYVAQRAIDFPMGLKGQPSYLTDDVHGLTYTATDLGVILTDVPLPRPRPDHVASATTAEVELSTAPGIEPTVVEVNPSGDAPEVTPDVTYPDAPIPQPRPRPGLQS
jgi:D-alanyl-D-alanine carboxypeptidase